MPLRNAINVDTTYLKPLTHPTVRVYGEFDWQITQRFSRLGEEVTVISWGFNRQDAIFNFKNDVMREDRKQDFGVIDMIAEKIYTIGIFIDWLMNVFRR